MSEIRKYAWYGSAVIASALMAVALLLAGPVGTAEAAHTTALSDADIAPGSTTNLQVTGLATTEEVQSIGGAGGTGTFTLTYSGQTTAAISCTATAAAVETAVEALNNITAVTPGGGALGTAAVTIQFDEYTGDTAGNPPQMTVASETCSTTGGAAPTVTTATAYAADIVQATIRSGSSGGAEFDSNNGQSITVVDNDTADTNNVTDAVTIVVQGNSAGTVIIDVTHSGGADTDSVVLTVTAAAAPGIVTLTSPASIPIGGSGSATADVETAGGTDIEGATVTFNASGVGSVYRTSSTATTCAASATGVLASSCTATTNSGGDATAFVQSSGASGTITLTATSGSVTDSDTISVVGTATGIEITTVAAPNVGAGGETTVGAKVTDANGTGIPSQAVTFTATAGATVKAVTSGADCPGTQSVSVNTNASGVATAEFCVPSGTAAGAAITVTASTTVGSTTLTDTETVTIASEPASVEITPASTSVAAGGTTAVTFRVLDAAGNVARADTLLTGAAGAGVLAGCTDVTVGPDGEVTCTFVAPGTAQAVTISGVATRGTNTAAGTATINVGGAVTPPPAGGDANFDRPISNIGVNTAVWGGGTVQELASATSAVGGISVTVFVGGEAKVLIPGAPAFVNAAFNAAFPGGVVPEGTIVLVVR